MEFSDATVGWLVLAALALGFGAVVAAAGAITGQRRVRRAYRMFAMGRREDVFDLLQRYIDEVRGLRADVAGVREYGGQLRELLRGTVSRVAVVRYDAFDEMGGHVSFSVALLDERGDGFVLTSIAGRADTRLYVKPLAGGSSRHHLSEEEQEAIEQAMEGGSRRTELAGRGRPRRAS